jgi:hypothetical protein
VGSLNLSKADYCFDMTSLLFVVFILLLFVASYLLARKDDKILDLQQRVEFLEQKVNKKLVSRLLFVELKSVNSVLDTLNNCFYQIDKEGDYDVETEYRLDDVTDEWWESLSQGDLEVVNRIVVKQKDSSKN